MTSSVPPPIGPEAGVADGALDAVLAHVAVAAVYLEALVGDLQHRALRQQLRHRHVADDVLAGDVAPQRRVGERLAGLHPGRHLRDLVADHLEVPDRAPEGLALERVVTTVTSSRRLIPPTAPSDISSRSQAKLDMIR